MKVIIAGGRDVHLSLADKNFLFQLVDKGIITELVCGMAKGIDIEAGELLDKLIPVKSFPADWGNLSLKPCKIKTRSNGTQYNVLAGFNRNRQMAEYAEALIVFRGGKGTEDMIKQAEFKNLKTGKAYDGFSRQRMLEW